MQKKKPIKRKKQIKLKPVEVLNVNKNLLPLTDTPPEEVVEDLQTLMHSRGWLRLKQIIQEQVDLWGRRMDEEDFKDMIEFKYVRDQKNIYRSLLFLPERHINLIIDKPGVMNEDPYL